MVVEITLTETIFRYQEARPRRILLVKEDLESRQITKMILESEGYQVVTTVDGKAAKGVYNESFDLVISDDVVPDKKKNNFIQEIKNDYPEVKYLSINNHQKKDSLNASKLTHKAFSNKMLIDVIENHLLTEE